MNAATVEHAGTEKFLMSHTRNTNVWAKPQDPAALDQAPRTKIYKLHEQWAVEHGYREKVQAPSSKHEMQAGSAKRQASSHKL